MIFHLGIFVVVVVYLLCSKGWSLLYQPGRGNPGLCVVALYAGRALRGSNATCLALCGGFDSLPPPATSKLGPSGADFLVGGLVYVLGPCGGTVKRQFHF